MNRRGSERPEELLAAIGEAVDRAARGFSSEELRDEATTLGEQLTTPLRVAVGGRVKAGKSTLVNALVGRRVAATAAGECTKVVAWYHYGERDRITVRGRDGSSWVVRPARDGSLPDDLGKPIDDIDHVDVAVTVRTIGDRTLIDTPGLFSLNDEFSAGTRRAFGMDEQSRGAVAAADALVYLMPHPGDTDRDFLEAFHGLYPESALSAASVVGVLSRIDLLCRRPGLEDPWPDARRVADRAARNPQLRRSLRTVVPVAGLLAETALGGSFTEADAAAVGRLAKSGDRVRMLSSVEAFLTLGVDDDGAAANRSRLLGLLGLYGVAVCCRLVDDGADGAIDLLAGLRAASGIDDLAVLLDADFCARAQMWRAWRALDELLRLSYRAGSEDREAANALRSDIEAVQLRPQLHAVAEMRALRDLDAGVFRLAPAREAELLAVARNTDVRSRLGLGPDAESDEVLSSARARWEAWRELENDERSSSAVRSAARVLRTSFERLLAALENSSESTGTSAPPPASNGH